MCCRERCRLVETLDGARSEVCITNWNTARVRDDRGRVDEVVAGSVFQVVGRFFNLVANAVTIHNREGRKVDAVDDRTSRKVDHVREGRVGRCRDGTYRGSCFICDGEVGVDEVVLVCGQVPCGLARRNAGLYGP